MGVQVKKIEITHEVRVGCPGGFEQFRRMSNGSWEIWSNSEWVKYENTGASSLIKALLNEVIKDR